MPDPFAFLTMSGNFDFPPATSSQDPITSDTEEPDYRDRPQVPIRPSGSERRAIEDSGWSPAPSSASRRIRDRESATAAIREEIERRHIARALNSPDVQAPISAERSRPHAMLGLRHLRRHIQRHREGSTLPESMNSVQLALERSNEASPSLSSLLDQPTPRLGSPDISAREYSGEAEVNRRRAKRRKLDNDLKPGPFKGFSYGYRGQVVPGALKMEIVSCDGGLHADAARHGRKYWQENVLRNDKDVYCTDSSMCNIILCHQGETTFCLKKLVVKAPERGFTAPIQEGLIFISMTSEDLLSRTDRYQVRETISKRTLQSEDVSARRPTSYPLQRISNENRPPSRRRDDTGERAIPPPVSNSRAYPAALDPQPTRNRLRPLSSFRHRRSTPSVETIPSPDHPWFTITTDCDNHPSDEEEESSAATLADRQRRDQLSLAYEYSSSEDTEYENYRNWALNPPLPSEQRGRRRRANPSRIEIAKAPYTEADEETVERDPDVLAPHARFFIEREKSMVTVGFDPPVSGKFILLKLWSPAKDQNIDIQSIVAYGFAGPRFFPAIQAT